MGGFYHPDGSPCTYSLLVSPHNHISFLLDALVTSLPIVGMTCITDPTTVVPRLALLYILQSPLIVRVSNLSIVVPLLLMLPVLLLLLPLTAVGAVILLVRLVVVSKAMLLWLLLLMLLLSFLESWLLRPRAVLLIRIRHRTAMLLLVVGGLVLMSAEAPSVWRHVLVRRRPILKIQQ